MRFYLGHRLPGGFWAGFSTYARRPHHAVATGGLSDRWHRVCRLHRARGRAGAEHRVLVHQRSCASADGDRRRRDRASPPCPSRAGRQTATAAPVACRRARWPLPYRPCRSPTPHPRGVDTASATAADHARRHLQGRLTRPSREGRAACHVLRRPRANAGRDRLEARDHARRRRPMPSTRHCSASSPIGWTRISPGGGCRGPDSCRISGCRTLLDATLRGEQRFDVGVGRRSIAATAAPAAVYLTAIEVEGFRGIGPPSILQIDPGPGLTLVVGRNGSGKSSFSEALEMVLLGTNQRWDQRVKVWRDGWQNLHHRHTRVAARFTIDGRKQPLDVARVWKDGDGVDGSTLTIDGKAASPESTSMDAAACGVSAAAVPQRARARARPRAVEALRRARGHPGSWRSRCGTTGLTEGTPGSGA